MQRINSGLSRLEKTICSTVWGDGDRQMESGCGCRGGWAPGQWELSLIPASPSSGLFGCLSQKPNTVHQPGRYSLILTETQRFPVSRSLTLKVMFPLYWRIYRRACCYLVTALKLQHSMVLLDMYWFSHTIQTVMECFTDNKAFYAV